MPSKKHIDVEFQVENLFSKQDAVFDTFEDPANSLGGVP